MTARLITSILAAATIFSNTTLSATPVFRGIVIGVTDYCDSERNNDPCVYDSVSGLAKGAYETARAFHTIAGKMGYADKQISIKVLTTVKHIKPDYMEIHKFWLDDQCTLTRTPSSLPLNKCNPTKRNVEDRIPEYGAEASNKKSSLFVYFAGHGAADLNRQEYLLFLHQHKRGYARGEVITHGQFSDLLAESPAGTKIEIIDACSYDDNEITAFPENQLFLASNDAYSGEFSSPIVTGVYSDRSTSIHMARRSGGGAPIGANLFSDEGLKPEFIGAEVRKLDFQEAPLEQVLQEGLPRPLDPPPEPPLPRNLFGRPIAEENRSIAEQDKGAGWLTYISTDRRQTQSAWIDEKVGYGYFTKYFVKGILENEASALNYPANKLDAYELLEYMRNKVTAEVFKDRKEKQEPTLENWRYANRAYIYKPRANLERNNIQSWTFEKDPLSRDIESLKVDIGKSIIIGFETNSTAQLKVSRAGQNLADILKQALSDGRAGTSSVLLFRWTGLIAYGLGNAATADFHLDKPKQNILQLAKDSQKYAKKALSILREKTKSFEESENLNTQQRHDLEEFWRFSYRRSNDEKYDDWLKYYIADTKAIELQLNNELTDIKKRDKAIDIFSILQSIRPKYLKIYPVRDLSPHLRWLCDNFGELGGNICELETIQR